MSLFIALIEMERFGFQAENIVRSPLLHPSHARNGAVSPVSQRQVIAFVMLSPLDASVRICSATLKEKSSIII